MLQHTNQTLSIYHCIYFVIAVSYLSKHLGRLWSQKSKIVNENKATFVGIMISLCKFLLGLKILLMVNNTSSQLSCNH